MKCISRWGIVVGLLGLGVGAAFWGLNDFSNRAAGDLFADKTSESGYQPWTKQFFNIRGKELSAERDYSLESVGIMEEIAGARCDFLILDDVQSLPSLGRTDKMLDKIRQDWLTRPGSLGRTFMIGTRVGPLDIYQALQDEGLVDHLVSYPAIIEGYDLWPRPTNKTDECLPPRDVKFLWPERYTPKNYLTMRINAGEIAWERNYMQRGADSASAPFTDEMLVKSQDPVRSVNTKTVDVKKANPSIERLVCTLDPGFGTNACMVAGFHPDGMWVLDGRIDKGLSTNGQIAQVVNELCAKWHMDGMQVTELVIEDKAFQRGLLKDDSFRDLAVKYGFQIRPYTTGSEKNDPDIGVPSMSAAFDQGRIMFPGADDPATNQFMKHILSQFTKWRPGIRGNRLTQDYVMTTWFAFLRWRKLRAQLDALGPNPDRSPQGAAGFRTVALPYGMTPVLLLDGSMR